MPSARRQRRRSSDRAPRPVRPGAIAILGMALSLAIASGALAQGSAGIGGIPPVAQSDVSLWTVFAIAALNPVAIAVAFLMGRRADQPAKLIVAAFAAAVTGVAVLWLGVTLRVAALATAGRAAGGIFAAGLVLGLGWAWLGYRMRRPGRP